LLLPLTVPRDREGARDGRQIETVHRVLRTLRGRALLPDEVGLGKTIEVLMVLLEYQLGGMASQRSLSARVVRQERSSP
jgi:hypothetical protein